MTPPANGAEALQATAAELRKMAPGVTVHAVAGDHDEPGPLQALVDLHGQCIGLGPAGSPARNIHCGNGTHQHLIR